MAKSTIDPQLLVRLGKGQIATVRHVPCSPWRGQERPSYPVFSEVNVEENKRLYPHLFRDVR